MFFFLKFVMFLVFVSFSKYVICYDFFAQINIHLFVS